MPAQVTADAASGTGGAAALATADATGRKAACRLISMSLMMFFFISAKRVKSLDVAGG
jgi:hypothetical protein